MTMIPFTRDDGRVVEIEVHWSPADPDAGITWQYIWAWDLPPVEPDLTKLERHRLLVDTPAPGKLEQDDRF